MRRFFLALVGFCVIAAGFFGGFSADVLQSSGQKPDALAQRLRLVPGRVAQALRPAPVRAAQDGQLPLQETYADVLRVVRSSYYGSAAGAAGSAAAPSSTKLTYAAIRGALRTLGDPYTVFWTPDEFARQMEDTRGDFGGIGAQLDVNEKKQVYVAEPIEDSPAARKGVQRGDIIVAVDGRPVNGLSVSSLVSRIRGKEGTNVRLTLQRGAAARPFDLVIERAIIHSPIVKARMQDAGAGVGYIALAQFNEQADEQFQHHLSQLEKKGMKALIFDLRGNPGGLLNIAQDLASRFIPSGKIVIVQERNGRESSLDVEQNKHQSRALAGGKYPVVVLVNGGSASASEIVSGAIKDHRIGTLIGTTTYGKGLVQTIIPVSDDAAVKVTTQRYFTPNHVDINKKLDEAGKQISGGITPDIEVKVTDADTEAMQKAYKVNPDDTSHDPQLNRAVAVLKDQLAGKLPRPVAAQGGTRTKTAKVR